MTTANLDFTRWNAATADLNWGVQRVLMETLQSVADEQITLVHGTDSHAGRPCLINAVANMIALDVTQVNPSSWFPQVVGEFDRLNRAFERMGVNVMHSHVVSPLAAEILINNFGTLKPPPTEADFQAVAMETLKAATESIPYIEPSDADMQSALDAMDEAPSVSEADVNAAFDAALRNS